MTTTHTPGPWRVEERVIKSADGSNITGCVPSRMRSADLALIASAPSLLAALKELLLDATGPAMVWGDGIGNDGKKTGLTHEEFNKLRAERIALARAALALAEGK